MKTFFASILAASAVLTLPLSTAQAAPGDTLKTVQQRGALNCSTGDDNFPGFFEIDAKGKWYGMDTDYCRALAVAIFGDDSKLKLIPSGWAQRFPSLQSGALDVVIQATGWTMSRDTELSLQFSTPYYVGASSIMAHKHLGVQSLAEMSGGTVCIAGGTSTTRLLTDYIKTKGYDIEVITFDNNTAASTAYFTQRCDAYSEFGPTLAAVRAKSANPEDSVVLTDTLALEPESAVVRQGDEPWLDIINWVIASTMIAEENGVTSANVDAMRANPPNDTVAKLLGATPGIGKRLGLRDDWAYHVIKIVGNAEEIYDRNLGSQSLYRLPRGVNAPWSKGGVFYPPILD